MYTGKKFCCRSRLVARTVDLSEPEMVYGKEWGHGRRSGQSFLPHLGMGVAPGLEVSRARRRHQLGPLATECPGDRALAAMGMLSTKR